MCLGVAGEKAEPTVFMNSTFWKGKGKEGAKQAAGKKGSQ